MKKILIIDDDRNLTKLMKSHLDKIGYSTLLAHAPDPGIKLAKDEKPDLILMDVMLPGMDGAQAVKLLKSEPLIREIPVIFLTALVTPKEDEVNKEQLLVDGTYYDSIGKPFDLNYLVKKIKEKME